MDSLQTIFVFAQLALDLDRIVSEQNEVANMDILKRIEQANGVLERVTSNVDHKLSRVFELEAKVDDLSTRATAPKIRDLDTVAAHLTQMVNAIEGNGGPLLGENQSTPSDGASPENPPQPQS